MSTGIVSPPLRNGLLIASGITPLAIARLAPVKMLPKKAISLLIYLRARKAGYSNRTSLMVVAQSRCETANYTSRLAKEDNNLFGMRPARIRKVFYQATIDTANGSFATYSNPYNSISDYLDLANYNDMPKYFASLQAFVSFLKSKRYFVEPSEDYYKCVETWM